MKITGYKRKHEYTNGQGVTSVVYLMDCMDLLEQLGEGSVPLCVCDPPYGIGEDGGKNHSRDGVTKAKLYTPKNWDNSAPKKDFFEMLNKKCQNVIIWGANHFIENIPKANSPSWIVWDKQNGNNDFADAELAYTNHKSAVRLFSFRWAGMLQGDMKNKETRIHPTQKPVKLYDWIYHNYAKPNELILDTHLGSGSSRIAAEKANLPFIGCELDEEYFDKSCERFDNFVSQQRIVFPD